MLVVKSIQPISSKPISDVPKYVYENCNQVTCNQYHDDYLKLIQIKAHSITLKQFNEIVETKKTSQGEELNWVNGICEISLALNDCHTKGVHFEDALTVDDVKRYNGLFSRFFDENNGEFRKEGIKWPKGDKSFEEELFYKILAGVILKDYQTDLPKLSEFGSKLSLVVPQKKIVNKIKKLVPNKGEVELSSNASEKYRNEVENFTHPKFLQTIDRWRVEQKITGKNIDLYQWLRDRFHFFPAAETIPAQLKETLKSIKHKEMHPIEKAAKIWYDIVQIHISHEANKRTGKALASAILLSHGYLPPKIGKDDAEEYKKVFIEGFGKVDGLANFTQFVARKVLDAQKEYGPIRNDHPVSF